MQATKSKQSFYFHVWYHFISSESSYLAISATQNTVKKSSKQKKTKNKIIQRMQIRFNKIVH